MTSRAAAFLALAREDLAVAKQVCEAFPRHADFAVQQAAEKLVKAVLVLENTAAPPTHQIGYLAARLPPEHPLRADLVALDDLTPAATMYRYPSPGGRLPRARPQEAIARDINRVAELLERVTGWAEGKE